MPESVTSQYS